MISAGKRSRNVLSIKDKMTIINRLEKGETGASLAKIFNIGKATISDIKSRKNEIMKFASQLDSEDGSKRRKTMKKASDEKLEDAVYLWFLQKRSQGEPISGPLLCKKALQLNQKLEGPSEFKASTGWLKNFKSRHGIRKFELQGEALTNDLLAAEAFKKSFLKVLEDESFSKEDIYKDDETELSWNSFSLKSLQNTSFSTGFTADNQHVTVKMQTTQKVKREVMNGPTHAEAFTALETTMAWCEQQSECSSQEIMLLKRIRDLAEKKIHDS